MSEKDKTELVKKLSKMSGKNLDCEIEPDPALLCGIVAKVGNKIYDFSLVNKLKQLEAELIEDK